MNVIVAAILLTLSACLILWSLLSQCRDIIEQIKIMRKAEAILLAIWDKPQFAVVISKFDEKDEALTRSLYELLDLAEAHNKQKAMQIAEKRKVVEYIRTRCDHRNVEKIVDQVKVLAHS